MADSSPRANQKSPLVSGFRPFGLKPHAPGGTRLSLKKMRMPVRLGRFEMPKSLTKDEATGTETYAKFIVEPFEVGYGQTVGNSLRRVLLSSLEGAAITSVRITGAQHEFATLPGIIEDVTDIVLNLKKIKFKAVDHEPRTVTINVNKEGQITAADIQTIQGIEVLNTNQIICTVDKKQKFEAQFSTFGLAVDFSLETKTSARTCRSELFRLIRFFRQ